MADLAGEKARVEVVAAPAIEKRIFVIGDRQVMLDEDLADLYGVETKRLIEQGTPRMSSPSSGWPCFRESCGAKGPSP